MHQPHAADHRGYLTTVKVSRYRQYSLTHLTILGKCTNPHAADHRGHLTTVKVSGYSLTHLTILGKCTNPMLLTIGDTSPLLR